MKKTAAMIAAAAIMILLIISANMGAVKSQPYDCYDACTTNCAVNFLPNAKRVARCERKCSITCNPGLQADGRH